MKKMIPLIFIMLLSSNTFAKHQVDKYDIAVLEGNAICRLYMRLNLYAEKDKLDVAVQKILDYETKIMGVDDIEGSCNMITKMYKKLAHKLGIEQ